MCDPKPGARCSADTWKELKEAERKLGSARAELERFPDDPGARRRVQQAEENLERKSAAYDSAHRGQRQLEAAIAGHEDPDSPDVDALRTRLYVGRATRISQKRALARSRGQSVEDETLEVDKALNRLRHPDGGFTRHADTGREETVGFFVSPYPEREQVIAVADLRPIHLLRYAKANRDLFQREGHYMGAWHDPDTGLVSLDVSVKTTSAEEARSLAQQHQQVAFFDAQTGTSVEVSNTARERIAGLTERNES